MQAAKAPNTFKAYTAAWKTFADWCREWRRCDPLPASPDLVREFITWAHSLRERPYKPASIRLATMAIRRYHKLAALPDPIDEGVRALLSGVVRQAARDGWQSHQAGKRHLTVEQLKKICSSLGTSPMEVRDRALILLGFASALRRCDISRLQTNHVQFEGDRVRLWIPLSKTDQEGKGRHVFVNEAKEPALCPVRALEKWRNLRLEYFGNFRGPLFLGCTPAKALQSRCLNNQGISFVLKRRLKAVGEDARDYGAHSMRSGMITAADAAGANVRSIMDRTGHKSLQSVMRYIKSKSDSNPLAGVL
jgi:integrase